MNALERNQLQISILDRVVGELSHYRDLAGKLDDKAWAQDTITSIQKIKQFRLKDARRARERYADH